MGTELMRGQLRRSDNVVARGIAGQALLIPLTQTGADLQKLYALNDTAAEVWSLLAEPCTGEQLVAALQEEYDTSADVIRDDVEPLLQELLERGFLTVEPGDE